jgi:hypothetical protein
MVRLEFVPDVDAVRDDIADYDMSDVGTLQHTMFFLPTHLIVGTRDLFTHASGVALEVPIVHVALVGLAAVRTAESQSPVRYDPPGGGTMFLVKDGETSVRITSMNDATAIVEYADLRAAFEAFAVHVRQFLSTHIPMIRQSPVWNPWIESGAEPDWSAE